MDQSFCSLLAAAAAEETIEIIVLILLFFPPEQQHQQTSNNNISKGITSVATFHGDKFDAFEGNCLTDSQRGLIAFEQIEMASPNAASIEFLLLLLESWILI